MKQMPLTVLEIEKNKLDLRYNELMQYLNALLIFGTTGLVSFIASFFLIADLRIQSAILGVSLIIALFVAYIYFILLLPRIREVRKKMDKLKGRASGQAF